MTRLIYVLRCFPRIVCDKDYLPKNICPSYLGLGPSMSICHGDCRKCWNEPMPADWVYPHFTEEVEPIVREVLKQINESPKDGE